MQLITLTERELDALYGEPAEVLKLYVCLRRRMDFETGLVGAENGVSWWALREDMFVEFAQGRRRDESGTPTEKLVRNKVERLVSIGLVESRTSYRRLVFFLPMAHKGQIRLKKVGQTLVVQAGMTSVGSECFSAQGFDENYPQEVGSTEVREVGHTSGIRLTPISEYKQQHTECPVDKSAALLSSEIVGWLKAAEKRRGKIVAVAEADKLIKSWVSRKVRADELEEAYALAVADREKQGNPGPIHVGFLDLFVNRVLGKRKHWTQAWSSIVEEGRRLGIEQSPGEPNHVFKLRVFAAAGISEEEAGRWRD